MIRAIKEVELLMIKDQYNTKKSCELVSKALDNYVSLLSKENLKKEEKFLNDSIKTNLIKLFDGYATRVYDMVTLLIIKDRNNNNDDNLIKLIEKFCPILNNLLKFTSHKHGTNLLKNHIMGLNGLLSEIYFIRKKYHEVIRLVSVSLEISYTLEKPYHTEPLQCIRSVLLTQMAKAEIRLGWKNHAISLLEKAKITYFGQKVYKEMSTAYFDAANAYLEENFYEKALACFENKKAIFDKMKSSNLKDKLELKNCNKKISELKNKVYVLIKQTLLEKSSLCKEWLIFDDTHKYIGIKLSNNANEKLLKQFPLPYERKGDIIYLKEIFKDSHQSLVRNVIGLIQKMLLLQNNNVTHKTETVIGSTIKESKLEITPVVQDENTVVEPSKKIKTRGNPNPTETEKKPIPVQIKNYFAEKYNSIEIYPLSNDHIPQGIYFGFFSPKNPEKVTENVLSHHHEILKRGKIVSGFFAQGVKFVKDKTDSDKNTFKTKDPSQDIRLVAELVEVAKDEENKQRFLYQFGTFKIH